MRRPLTWSIAAGAAACLILLLRCKNRARAHKFNPSKLQNHDCFSSDFVLLLSRKLRKYQPQGSPLQPPAAPYVPSRCRKLRQRGGVLRNRGLLNETLSLLSAFLCVLNDVDAHVSQKREGVSHPDGTSIVHH